MQDRKIYCDCCGNTIVAEIKGNKLIIRKRSNRKDHVRTVIIDKSEELSLN